MRSIGLVLAVVASTTIVGACHAQPPPPPPAGAPISEEKLATLTAEMGEEPIIAFDRKAWAGREPWLGEGVLIRGLFLNKGNYRLAGVATRTPAVFDSLWARGGFHGVFREWHKEVATNDWLSMRDYPENGVGRFEWFLDAKTARESPTLTFIAWRNNRPLGRPHDADSEILPTPVGQVSLKEDGLTVLKGGLR